MRPRKSYSGDLMERAISNEEIILHWLENGYKSVIDFREFRLAQRIDVDFGIETIDGKIVLAEIKSDKHLSPIGNLLFENHRINHFKYEKWFYLGWGWRSPAEKLIIRNHESGYTLVFPFNALRVRVAAYIGKYGRKIRMDVVETDDQKTTFNFLIPLEHFTGLFKEYEIKTEDYEE